MKQFFFHSVILFILFFFNIPYSSAYTPERDTADTIAHSIIENFQGDFPAREILGVYEQFQQQNLNHPHKELLQKVKDLLHTKLGQHGSITKLQQYGIIESYDNTTFFPYPLDDGASGVLDGKFLLSKDKIFKGSTIKLEEETSYKNFMHFGRKMSYNLNNAYNDRALIGYIVSTYLDTPIESLTIPQNDSDMEEKYIFRGSRYQHAHAFRGSTIPEGLFPDIVSAWKNKDYETLVKIYLWGKENRIPISPFEHFSQSNTRRDENGKKTNKAGLQIDLYGIQFDEHGIYTIAYGHGTNQYFYAHMYTQGNKIFLEIKSSGFIDSTVSGEFYENFGLEKEKNIIEKVRRLCRFPAGYRNNIDFCDSYFKDLAKDHFDL